jgi:CelD/BcsL family acetyltransferase involved in cellulose biosynthesis
MTTPVRVRIVRGSHVLSEVAALRSAAPTPFQTAGWYWAWISEAAASEQVVPILVQAKDSGDALVSVALQLHTAEEGGAVLRPLSWPWADYHCAWTQRTDQPEYADTPRVLAAALEEVQRVEDARLDLADVLTGGLLHRAAQLLGARESPASPVVAIDLTDAGRVAAVVERKEIVRKRRLLARRGEVSVVHRRTAGDITAQLPSFFSMHAAQWRQREDVVAPFDGGTVDRTFTAVAQRPDTGAVLSELRLDSVPVAMYFGFLHADRFWAYRTAFDQTYRRLSPGHQLVVAMIEDFVASGVRTFDLMRGEYPYKLEYASTVARNVRLERGKP